MIRTIFDRHVQVMERATSDLSAAERSTLVTVLKQLGMSAERRLEEGKTGVDRA